MRRVAKETAALDAYDIVDNFTNSELQKVSLSDAQNALAVFDLAADSDKRDLNALIWARVISSELESALWRVNMYSPRISAVPKLTARKQLNVVSKNNKNNKQHLCLARVGEFASAAGGDRGHKIRAVVEPLLGGRATSLLVRRG